MTCHLGADSGPNGAIGTRSTFMILKATGSNWFATTKV